MDRPLRCLPALCALCVACAVCPAEEPQANGAALDRAPSQRAISPRMAAILAAARPKYVPETSKKPDLPPILLHTEPAEGGDDIVRLPTMIVQDKKLPGAMEVNPGEFSRRITEQYLGPENGLDRGVLNLVTIADLWRKIPLLGRLPAPFGSMTNQQRAQVLYGQDERLRKMHDLLDMAELAKKSGAGPAGVDLKKEVQQTFMRKPWE